MSQLATGPIRSIIDREASMTNPLNETSNSEISTVQAIDDTTSRRDLLRAGAGLLSAATAAPLFCEAAQAQGGFADLTTVLSRPRILIRGGIVLSLERRIGDFADADVLIEDGKIRDVGPRISASDAAVIDATHHIVIPGFVDTHHHFYQGILRNILSNGLLNPDYQ